VPPAPPAVQSLQSTEQYTAEQTGQVYLMVAAWTAVVAAAISLVLALGQMLYQGKSLPVGLGLLAVGGGLAAGALGGTAGQVLYSVAPDVSAFRVVGWLLLGGLVGVGLSFVVPNLRKTHGLIGGAVGGLIGAVAFIGASSVTDFLGRMVGAGVVGLCIGFMVALVEAAFRRAWLEVRLGGREQITVNLGPEPVSIGSDARNCTVFARGASPLALRYWLRNGSVVCHDHAAGREVAVGEGDLRTAGSVEVTVRTGGAPAPRSVPTPAPASVMPTPARAPAPAPAPVMSMPAPAAPRPMVPPPPPAATGPTARCPECGSPVTGQAGLRICKNCGAIS
jgi:hypothetical protein